jgi:dTDP-4-dehydrorhamnose reductase
VKVLITGAGGQVGRALLSSVPPGVQALALDRNALDIRDGQLLAQTLLDQGIQVLINAAAYTAVDQAETEREQAFAVNATAVGVLARACSAAQVRLVHISTDFVFDGAQSTPYRPDAATNPLSVYGASKREAERLLAAQPGLDHVIVRTSWVYASAGRNFVLTMLRLFRERTVVRVISDQIGTPTSAGSLSRCIWAVVAKRHAPAMLHFSDAGVASWYDFAVAVYEEARALGLLDKAVQIVPITAAEYPTAAVRPRFSVLDKTQTFAELDLTPEHWRQTLRGVLAEMRA